MFSWRDLEFWVASHQLHKYVECVWKHCLPSFWDCWINKKNAMWKMQKYAHCSNMLINSVYWLTTNTYSVARWVKFHSSQWKLSYKFQKMSFYPLECGVCIETRHVSRISLCFWVFSRAVVMNISRQNWFNLERNQHVLRYSDIFFENCLQFLNETKHQIHHFSEEIQSIFVASINNHFASKIRLLIGICQFNCVQCTRQTNFWILENFWIFAIIEIWNRCKLVAIHYRLISVLILFSFGFAV